MSLTSDVPGDRPGVSVVLPCLNEEQTIGMVIAEIHDVMRQSIWVDDYEVIVADNGSTDASRAIASTLGATVVAVPVKGYGAALQAGILSARFRTVVTLDSDFTYDATFIPALVSCLQTTRADLVLGTRLRGRIEPGAMPFLHRRLGTPVLTGLINMMWRSSVSDVNSGMRAFSKSSFQDWDVQAQGMEFASEMVLKCLRRGGSIGEIPIRLRADPRNRQPHLKRWDDGMRHLLLILSSGPHLFVNVALVLIAVTTVLVGISVVWGPLPLGRIQIFGFHTVIVSILFGFLGAQSLMQGLTMEQVGAERSRVARILLNINEGILFWLLVGTFAVTALAILTMFLLWGLAGFRSLAYFKPSLGLTYLASVVGSVSFGLFNAHISNRLRTSHEGPPNLTDQAGEHE